MWEANLRQVGLVNDGSGSSEVGGDTNVLEDGGQGGEGLGVGVRELVGTRLNSSAAEGSGEERDVRSFVLSDLREPKDEAMDQNVDQDVSGNR
jgi:hypothetical protein